MFVTQISAQTWLWKVKSQKIIKYELSVRNLILEFRDSHQSVIFITVWNNCMGTARGGNLKVPGTGNHYATLTFFLIFSGLNEAKWTRCKIVKFELPDSGTEILCAPPWKELYTKPSVNRNDPRFILFTPQWLCQSALVTFKHKQTSASGKKGAATKSRVLNRRRVWLFNNHCANQGKISLAHNIESWARI